MNSGTRLRRAFALVGVTLCATSGGMLAFGATMASAASTVRTCGSGSNAYTVTVPSQPTSNTGADPEETAAANCTIGYHEKEGFPFAVIALVLAATAATFALLHWKRDSLDLGWSENDPPLGTAPFLAGGTNGGEL